MIKDQDEWAINIEEQADLLMFRFDVGHDDGMVTQQLWYTGSHLHAGQDESGGYGLCVSYDDGDHTCHVDIPAIAEYGQTWFLVEADTE